MVRRDTTTRNRREQRPERRVEARRRGSHASGTSRQGSVLLLVVVITIYIMISDRYQGHTGTLDHIDPHAEEAKSVLSTITDGLGVTTEAPFEQSKFDYTAPVNATEYTVSPPIRTNQTTVVIVLSGRNHFERRAVIRDTWARLNNNVYFVIGGPEPNNQEDKNLSNPLSVSSLLFKEQKIYEDIIDCIHPDSYKSLPYKLHYAMKWVVNNLAHVNWVVKADDDHIVRVRLLQFFVLRKFNPDHPSVIGGVVLNAPPHRTGKWAEDPKFIDPVYPPWTFGSAGYIVSRQVAEYIAKKEDLYYYQGEDAGLGIWLAESPLQITWIDTPELNNNKMCEERYYIIGHDLTVDEMRSCYESIGDDVPERKSIIAFAAGRRDQHPGKIHGV